MSVSHSPFDQKKIDLLKNLLVSSASKHTPVFYEIFIDDLKVVPKTNNPDEFDDYEDYVRAASNHLAIKIYNGTSNKNDQHFFSFTAKTPQEALEQALEGIQTDTYSQKDLKNIKQARFTLSENQEEIKALKKRLNDLNDLVKQKDDHISRCEGALNVAKENGNKIGGIHLGEAFKYGIKAFLKQNAPAIEKATGLSGLAGIFEDETSNLSSSELPNTEAEVSFRRKESQTEISPLTEQEKEFVKLCKVMRQHFNEQEMDTVMSILDTLSRHKDQIQPVLELLKD